MPLAWPGPTSRRLPSHPGMVAEIHSLVAERPTYGYRRVHALLRRRAAAMGRPPPNHKRVYRVMKAHGLLLARQTGATEGRRHDGRIAVERGNRR
jgi:putative transposase